MKLQELSATKKSKQINNVLESYFETSINLNRVTPKQANAMLSRVRGLINEHRQSSQRHTSERNPAYLKLMMMEQALSSHIKEQTPAVVKKATPMMKAESRLRRAYKMLKESEVQQAQVVLAAQDMVDKMQSMLEDVSELQFKELPALVDSIKNQVGVDQAAQFNTDATAALTGLLQNIQGAKQQLDQALGVVTGQAAAPDLGMQGAELGADVGADVGAELGADVGDELDSVDADAAPDLEAGDDLETAALGNKGSLGRARR